MKYDPIKKTLGKFFNKTPFLRKIFYKLLDLLLLRSWHVRKELKKWAKGRSDAYILDAGSGFGQYDFYMSKLNKNFKILGVDVKQDQIDDCTEFFRKIGKGDRVKFQYADLTKFKTDKTFDLILSVDVMEHIEDDVKVFRNFYASLKDDGLLLISTPSNFAEDHDDHDHDGFHVDEHVRDGYSPEDIKQKLQTAGFKDIKVRYTYGKPGGKAWVLSMKIPMLMLNVSQLFFVILPFYYLVTYPVAFVLNWIDTVTEHEKGGSVLVKARK